MKTGDRNFYHVGSKSPRFVSLVKSALSSCIQSVHNLKRRKWKIRFCVKFLIQEISQLTDVLARANDNNCACTGAWVLVSTNDLYVQLKLRALCFGGGDARFDPTRESRNVGDMGAFSKKKADPRILRRV